MRTSQCYFLLLSFFLFVQCSKDNSGESEDPTPNETQEEPTPEPEPEPEPEPIVYFTFTVDGSIDTSKEDNWILIHDENGKILDYKFYETGETLEFMELESNLTEFIHVSLFHRQISLFRDENDQFVEGDRFKGTTYPNIPLKSNWTRGQYDTTLDRETELTSTGDFTINLLNFTHYNKVLNSTSPLGSPWGNLSAKGGPPYASGGSAFYSSTNTFEINGVINYDQNPDYLWTFLDQENYEFKYTFFKDPENGMDIELDYNEFSTPETIDYLPVLPENQRYEFAQIGYESEADFKSASGYFLLMLFSNPDLGGNGIPIPSLNRFKYYSTRLLYLTEEYSYFFRLEGPLMSVAAFPENPNISTSGDIDSFEISSNMEYVRREDSWIGKTTVAGDFNETEWKIICDANTYPKITEFPEELKTRYPSISPLNELERYSTRLFLQGDTYRKNLERLFDPGFDHIIKIGFVSEQFNFFR